MSTESLPRAVSKRSRRSYGMVRRLPSGRYQASHLAPDGQRHNAPYTFDTKGDADAWLAAQRTDIARGEWEKPDKAPRQVESFADYAENWLATRTLRIGTRTQYRRLLDTFLLEEFGKTPLDEITPVMVRRWHGGLADKTGPVRRAHAYALLKVILTTAVTDDLIPTNPCRIRGASKSARTKEMRPATLAELETIADNMPAQYRLAILLAAWCGLRFGEVAGLRRKDIDLKSGVLHIRQGVTYIAGQGDLIGPPKTAAGVRNVAIPPDLLPEVRAHLLEHAQPGAGGLVFSTAGGKPLRMTGGLRRHFERAREAAGRPDLTFHDLRHTGATLAAAAGATVAELMARIGHTTPQMAMRYQHATSDRDRAIAEALSEFRTGGIVRLRPTSTSATDG